jgi:hypothetical protein
MGVRVRQARAQARRRLAWMAAVFVGVQLTASVVLDVYGTRVRFPELVNILRKAAAAPAPSVTFLGSSRTESCVDAALITNIVQQDSGDAAFQAFRAAVPVGDPVAEDRMLNDLLRHDRRPEMIVIEVAPELLGRTNFRSSEHFRRQMHWDEVLDELPEAWRAHRLHRLLLALVAPFDVHRYHLLKEAGRLWEEGLPAWSEDYALTAPGGQEPMPPAWEASVADNARVGAAALAGVSSATGLGPAAAPEAATPEQLQAGTNWVAGWLRYYEIGGHTAECLEHVLEVCRQQGIVAILVEPPVCALHRTLYTPEIEAAYRAYVAALRERYGCVLVDARAWCGDACFRDNHHLNHTGEQCFSERFAREVLAPAWREYRGLRPAR